MKKNKGEFICPKCKWNEMGGFSNWLSKIVYNNNEEEETYWIFYKKTIWSKKECKCSYKKGWPFSEVNDWVKCACCYFLLWGLVLYTVVYILIISWIDIIKYCCCKKNTYKYQYSYIDSKIKEGEIISKDDENCIFKQCEGTSENVWIRNGYSLFHCNNCKWKSKTFKDFITIPPPPPPPLNEKNIAIIMTPQNQSFHYSIVCNLNNTFEKVENELYKEYPEYKDKELFFLLNGNGIQEKTKTLKELGFKNSDNIIICENILRQ